MGKGGMCQRGGFIGEGRKGGARGWSEMAGRRRSMNGKKETYEGGNFVVPGGSKRSSRSKEA